MNNEKEYREVEWTINGPVEITSNAIRPIHVQPARESKAEKLKRKFYNIQLDAEENARYLVKSAKRVHHVHSFGSDELIKGLLPELVEINKDIESVIKRLSNLFEKAFK